MHQFTPQSLRRSLGEEVVTIPVPFALAGHTEDLVLDILGGSKNQASGHLGGLTER